MGLTLWNAGLDFALKCSLCALLSAPEVPLSIISHGNRHICYSLSPVGAKKLIYHDIVSTYHGKEEINVRSLVNEKSHRMFVNSHF